MKHLFILFHRTLLIVPFIALILSCQTKVIDPQYKLIAHRGGVVEGLYTEYDPRSMEEAIQRGYAMLEIDLRATSDKEIVIHHDRDLNATFGVDKTTEELTLSEIQQLKSLKEGFSLMSLDDICKKCNGKVGFMLDIKYKGGEQWFFDKINETLSKYDMWDNTIVLSGEFEPMLPLGRFGFGSNQVENMKQRIAQGEAIHQKYYLFDIAANITPETIKWCKENNIEVCAAINIFRYKKESIDVEVKKHIAMLKENGVTTYQIDSGFDIYFRK